METVISNRYIKEKTAPQYDYLEGAIFLLYFCITVFTTVFTRVLGWSITVQFYYLLYYGSLFFYALTRGIRKFILPFVLYFVVFILFAFAFLRDPELGPWFSEKKYSVSNTMLRAYSGIWAFLILSIVSDKKTILFYLRISCFLLFVILVVKFIRAQQVGYWKSVDAEENPIEASYDMAFGYDMLFVDLYFIAEAVLNRKRYCYIPFFIGAFCILLAGSRGPVLCLICSILMLILFKWRTLSKNQKKITLLVLIFLCPVILLFMFNFEKTLMYVGTLMRRIGINSRTITAFAQGEITGLSGRDRITEIVLKKIAEGGLFGNGVYGERTAVGQIVKWGYAHNIFLEIYAAFGYLGGSIITAGLIFLTVKTIINCRDKEDQIIFLVFFGSSIKLLISDSFWFNRTFWALLAIMITSLKQNKEQKPTDLSLRGIHECKYLKQNDK